MMNLVELANQDGRKWVRVGDCYRVTKKPRDLDVRAHAAIPFVPMESVPQGGAYERSYAMKSPGSMTSGTYFERGDVLLAKITPSFENGKQALAQSLPSPFGYATTEVIPLHPIDGRNDDPRLLFFYLLHPDVRHFVAERMEGSTGRQRVPENVLLDLLIPELMPNEQRQVADVLELIQKAIAFEDKAVHATSELKHSTMHTLFTQGLRSEAQKETEFGKIPRSWKVTPLESLAEIQTGVAKGRKFDNAETIDVPYLRVANVQDGHLDLREMKQIQIKASELERYRLRAGDVVLTEGGDFDKLGRGFIWRGELDICVHQNHVFAVRADAKQLLPEFLAYLAQSPYGKAYFLQVAHKTTNLACINSTKLKAFPSIVPSIEEQNEIVAILDAVDAKMLLHQRKRGILDELFKSLLHKLMTGEIHLSEINISAVSSIGVSI